MFSAPKSTILIVALALSVATPARAADGADGQNGNGAGQPAINNQTPLQGGGGGDGTDGGKGGKGGIGALVTGGGVSSNTSAIAGGTGGVGGAGSASVNRGVGGAGGSGGVGVFFVGARTTFTNSGSVTGGTGGVGGKGAAGTHASGGEGGSGGVGVYFAGNYAALVNNGVVTGGEGGAGGVGEPFAFGGGSGGSAGAGGTGIYFSGNGASVINNGSLFGGTGGSGGAGIFAGTFGGAGGSGGVAVFFAGDRSRLFNTNLVTGGAGGAGGATPLGDGTIIIVGNGGEGGAGGTGAYFAGNRSWFFNSGAVAGGAGGAGGNSDTFGGRGGAGGTAVYFSGDDATFANSGSVTGGAGGAGGGAVHSFYGGWAGAGGVGAYFAHARSTFTNFGSVTGGAGDAGGGAGGDNSNGGAGGSGGRGASFAADSATFTNSGRVIGGAGGAGGAGSSHFADFIGFGGGRGGFGGIAAYFAGDHSTLVNSGSITGGAGGAGGHGVAFGEGGAGGTGGAAVFFGKGANFLNTGVASGGVGDRGGAGGAGGGRAGATGSGGVGVVGNGVTLINGGTISGGLSGDGKTRASAIVFNSGVNVLESLAGSRIVGGVKLNGGSLALKGVANVVGDLAFKPGSNFIARIGGASASQFNLSGVARLGGSLVATASFPPGSALMRNYSIIHAAGGFANTGFATTELNLRSLPPGLRSAGFSYGANDLSLNLTSALGAGALLNQNQQAVAAAINNGFNAGGVVSGRLSNLYWLNGGALPAALTMASGEAATGAQQPAFRATEQFLLAMLDPTAAGRENGGEPTGPALAYAPERPPLPQDIVRAYTSVLKAPAVPTAAIYQPPWTSWASAFGGYNRLGGDPTGAGSHTLSGGSFGVAGGFDYHVSQDTLLGAALAGGGTNWGLADGLGGGGSSVLHAGAYGSTRMGPAYLSGAFAFANHWMTTARAAAFGDALSASFDAQTYGGRVEGGYRLTTSVGGVTPYAAVQTQSFVTPGYAETGALVGGFGLAYQGRTASDTRTELGAKLDHVVALQPDVALALRGRLAWAHDWVSDPTLLATFQTLPGAGFLVEGALPVKNAALVSSGVELRLAEGATLSARFDGGFAPRGQSYAGTIGLRYSW